MLRVAYDMIRNFPKEYPIVWKSVILFIVSFSISYSLTFGAMTGMAMLLIAEMPISLLLFCMGEAFMAFYAYKGLFLSI